MERAVPILPADDLRIAREFYIDKLGFTIRRAGSWAWSAAASA